MSYGLYDGDLRLYNRVPFFNLELMKIATYYKRKREIVAFSPSFKPNMYSHFIVRQDYPSKTIYPHYKNIEYGGRAFSGSVYKPLPIDIEQSHADISIYDKVKIPYIKKEKVKESFSTMRRAEHVRISLDGKTIWKDWEKQLRYTPDSFGIIFHDYDLGQIEGAYELITENIDQIIKSKKGRRIGMKFPTIVKTEEDFVKWYDIPVLNQYFYLQYDGYLTTENIDYLKTIYSPYRALQINLNITGQTTEEQFINSEIIQLFKYMLDLRREGIVFPLIYDKGFFTDSQWEEVVKLIIQFNHHSLLIAPKTKLLLQRAPYETLYSYVKSLIISNKKNHKDSDFREHALEVFQFVRENNYDLFKMFYEYTGEKK